MSKYILSNKAVNDLSKIWEYTYEVWSENQADKYYFELLVDDDIPETEICSSISKFKSENKFVDEDFNCEERKDLLTRVNIYGSNITEQDIEQCGI